MGQRPRGVGPGPGARARGAGSGAGSGKGALAVAVIAGALAAGLVLARQATYGVGLDWDGLNYIVVARHLLAGEGFTDHDGGPFTLWTPLYPALLAALGFGRFDPYAVAGPLGALSFGLAVFFTARFLGDRLGSPFLRAWAPLAAALSLPLAEVSWFARSESPFLLFTTLALLRIEAVLRAGRRADLLAAGAFAALALLARYMGVAVVAAGGGLLLFAGAGAALGERLRRALVFCGIAGLPMGLWLARNFLLVGTLTGHRRPVDYSPLGLLRDIGEGVAGWGAADFGTADFGTWPYLLLGAASAVVVGAWGARRPARGGEGGADRARGLLPAAVFGGYSLAYLALLYAALLLGNSWNGVEWRYLTPVYLPLLVTAAVLLDRAPASRGLRVLRGGAFAAAAFWAFGQAAPTARAVARANSAETIPENGYGGAWWRRSETLRHLREHFAPGDTVYSNLPALAAFHTDGPGEYRPLPSGLYDLSRTGGSGEIVSPQERLERWLPEAEEGASVLWFWDGRKPPYRFTPPPALAAAPGLAPVAEYPDGIALQVVRAGGPSAGVPGDPPDPPDPDRPDRFRAALDAIASGEAGEPAAAAEFDLYLEEDTLTYHRSPCSEEDLPGEFFLHIYPADREALPAARRGHGFANLHFPFTRYGVLLSGRCVAPVPLPPYEITRLRTGQRGAAGGETRSAETRSAETRSAEIWSAELRPSSRRLASAYESFASGSRGEPAVRAEFDLYLDLSPDLSFGGGEIAYLKRPCAAEDAAARVFLHIYPEERESLPGDRQRYGFENRDFAFAEYGARFPGGCFALAPLPEYRIARIRTGQLARGGPGESWSAEVLPAAPDADRPTGPVSREP